MSDDTQSQIEALPETFDLIGSTIINGVLYGVALALYSFCARLLYPQLKGLQREKHIIFMFAYASVVMLCGTIFISLTARVNQLTYITHRNFSGGPMAYQGGYLSAQPIGFVYSTCSVCIDLLTMGIQIWRLWVIWSATRFAVIVMILPSLLLLSFLTMDIISIFQVVVLPNIFDRPWSFKTLIGLQLAFTVVVTALVIARLMLVRRRHIKLMGASETSKQYTSIATMLIESYALESAWTIAAIASYASGSPVALLFTNSDVLMKVVTYLLVLYRVSTGRAWNRQTERQISTLRWNHDTSATTDE